MSVLLLVSLMRQECLIVRMSCQRHASRRSWFPIASLETCHIARIEHAWREQYAPGNRTIHSRWPAGDFGSQMRCSPSAFCCKWVEVQKVKT